MFVNQFKRVYQFRIVLKGTKPPIYGKALKLHQNFFEDDFDPEFFDPDNVFFTAGSGNPPLPDDLPDRLMKILKEL